MVWLAAIIKTTSQPNVWSGAQQRMGSTKVKYVEAGWLGRKTGRGFYDYTGDEPATMKDLRKATEHIERELESKD